MLLFRRLRGLLGTSMAWAVGWAPIRVSIAALAGAFTGAPAPVLVAFVVNAAFEGALNGLIFGGITMIAERGKSATKIPLWRGAVWGIAAACILPTLSAAVAIIAGRLPGIPALVGQLAVGIGVGGVLGAASSSGMLLLARRGAAAALPQAHDNAPSPTPISGSLTRR